MSDTFEFIDAEYATNMSTNMPEAPSIVLMCVWLQVSRSGYYEWRDRPESATARRHERLKQLITLSFEDSDGTYGYRRIHADLAAQGIACGPELVRAIMRELGLQPGGGDPDLAVHDPATVVVDVRVLAPVSFAATRSSRDGLLPLTVST